MKTTRKKSWKTRLETGKYTKTYVLDFSPTNNFYFFFCFSSMFRNRKTKERKLNSRVQDCSFPFQISTQIIKIRWLKNEKLHASFISFLVSFFSVLDCQWSIFRIRFLSVSSSYQAGGFCVGRSDIIEVLLDCDAYFFSFVVWHLSSKKNVTALKKRSGGREGGEEEEARIKGKTRQEKWLIDNWQLSIFFSAPVCSCQPVVNCSAHFLGKSRSRACFFFRCRHLTNNTLTTTAGTSERERNFIDIFRLLLSRECWLCDMHQ